jgi:hypothetical protein
VYSPLPSVELCIEQQCREKKHRKETGGLHIVPNWLRRRSYAHSDPYRDAILVITTSINIGPPYLRRVHCLCNPTLMFGRRWNATEMKKARQQIPFRMIAADN